MFKSNKDYVITMCSLQTYKGTHIMNKANFQSIANCKKTNPYNVHFCNAFFFSKPKSDL